MVFARRAKRPRVSVLARAADIDVGIMGALRAVGSLLIPQTCVFCGEEHREGGRSGPVLCMDCRRRLTPPIVPTCHRCASPLPQYWGTPDRCPRCFDRNYHFDQTVAVGTYRDALRDAILCMKRAQGEPLVHAMADILADRIVGFVAPGMAVDIIVSTPMHWWRRVRRGVHPARILATDLARRLRTPLVPRLLRCRRATKKQGTLTPAQRFRNVRSAYDVVAGYDLTGKHVMVIDDVMTTGATLDELARILKQRGASVVTGAVVARGIGH